MLVQGAGEALKAGHVTFLSANKDETSSIWSFCFRKKNKINSTYIEKQLNHFSLAV